MWPHTAIEKLDASTRVKLRSSQILTSLPQIVSELVQNSLDAGASNVDIGVDCEEWTCWVRDDGNGIKKEGLLVLSSGSEEGRYASSKTYQSDELNALSTFGFRGEALASTAELGCMEISSRTIHSRDTWSIITKGSKCLYSGPAVRWRRESPGTVVCIRDAFYNLPVRRLSHTSPNRTLEIIRHELESYALVFPSVNFTLENTHADSSSARGHIHRIPMTTSSLATFRNLYGRALVEHVGMIDNSLGSLRLEGFVSLNGAHSKGYQFLYINRHPVTRCDLHQIVDAAFASSTFAKNALDEAGEIDMPRANIRRSPRKIERKAVYVLNLTIPPEQLDNCMEPAKTQIQFAKKDAVLALISSTIRAFLSQHGFFSPASILSRPGSRTSSPPPRKRRNLLPDSDSGGSETSDSRKPQSKAEDGNILYSTLYPGDDVRDINWTDPRTGQTFLVNPRTGNSHPQIEPVHRDGELVNALRDRRRTIRPCEIFSNRDGVGQHDTPEWLKRALRANQAYETRDIQIHKFHTSMKFQDGDSEFRSSERAGTTLDRRQHQFQKEDLHRATVINQVDTKFIACLIDNHTDGNEVSSSTPQGRVLILIDQHAADERIRVEHFLNDLCTGYLRSRDHADGGIQVKELLPPFPILLTLHEARRLKESSEFQDAFHHWGFNFEFRDTQESDVPDGNTGSDYVQVMIQSIPEIVSDKGDELRDLVKGFLGQLETDMPPISWKTSVDGENKGGFPWLKALRWCPRELLDLINSKACRGAIMFNDALSISQCQDLVLRLSETAFPFQCAHGRPSMIPLTDLGMSVTNKRSLNWSKLDDYVA